VATQLIDVDEIRRLEIRMHGLTGIDDAYTFYHDETNNIHKLRIDANGLNVAEPKVFALGGVVHTGSPRPIDIAPLRQAMRIQSRRASSLPRLGRRSLRLFSVGSRIATS
jgi:hypothetical protein